MAAATVTRNPRLRRADCTGPGIARRRHGRGFRFLDADGEPVDDDEVLRRIDELVIPPAWEDVWICPYPGGHIQATGVDAAGRKQYLYHPRWRERRDMEKFEDMLVFARTLPRLRKRVDAELDDGDELAYDRVCACAVRLLDRGFFRVGGEDYAVRNESYGLATMKKSHVSMRDGVLVFDYPAKSRQAPRAGGDRPGGRRRRRATSSAAAAAATSCWPTSAAGAGSTCALRTSTPG